MNRIRVKQLLRIAAVAVVGVLLMVPATGWAQSKPWARLSNGVLTFTYGAKPSEPVVVVKCTKCGKTLAAADKFCSNCGTARPARKSNVFEVPLAAKISDYPWYKRAREVKRVVFSQSFRQCTNITSTAFWFYDMINLTSISGLENLRTGNVTNMRGMFWLCESLTLLNLSSFNTSNVTDMGCMFLGCKSLASLNLSSFNTSKVTSMIEMFCGCKSLISLNISKFDTSKVTHMISMFDCCEKLKTLDLSHFNTANVENMALMFRRCKSLTALDLSNFDTGKVCEHSFMYSSGMSGMFESCHSLKSVILSSFNTANVPNMENMFKECRSLTTLDLSNFNTDRVESMISMFEGCSSLKTIIVPANSWDMERVRRNGDYTSTTDMFKDCPAQVIKK